jgi:hypothetical protein
MSSALVTGLLNIRGLHPTLERGLEKGRMEVDGQSESTPAEGLKAKEFQ